MASIEKINVLNVPGSLFVDTTCIDCGTCYHLAPGIFSETNSGLSYVSLQPRTLKEWSDSKKAMVSCPTNSIGVEGPPPEFRQAMLQLPLLVSENVYYCGFTSRESFGASSYFIERPEGNVLIDSPRFHPTLIKELEGMGGVKTMILTHRDDVADHALFAQHFSCDRVIHHAEVTQDTMTVEKILDYKVPFDFDHDLKVIPSPGHTKGHWVVLYKDQFLFSGDHVFFNQEKERPMASKEVCWYSWQEQIDSMKLLLNYHFEWILPGHGGWGRLKHRLMRQQMSVLIAEMERA